MRVRALMLAPYFHPHIGGVETHVLKVSEELVRQGHEVTVLAPRHEQHLAENDQYGGIRVLRFPGLSPAEGRGWLFTNRSLLREVDVVHCHDFNTFFDLYLPFRLAHPTKPTYVTFHGHEGILPIPKLVMLKRRVTERLADGNICIGDFIPKWYGTRADVVCYGGTDAVDEAAPSEFGAVFIGRLEEDTGILIYLEALRLLKAGRGIDLCLDVYGDGRLRGLVEDLAQEHGLTVRLHGAVREPWHGARGEFAFVSGYLSILEAMARKRLVFAVYGNELKKDYLTMIPEAESMMEISSSPESLAKALDKRLADREGCGAMVARAHAFSRQCSWKMVADKYLQLWGTSNG